MSVSLYNLLPAIIRYNDMLSSGEDSVLENIVYALEQETDETTSEIDGLGDLIDVDKCSVAMLAMLSFLLGEKTFAAWSEDKKRAFVRGLVSLYKIKGQKRSLEKLLSLFGVSNVTIYELWKSQVNEYFDYSRTQDYDHQLRAARIEYVGSDASSIQIGLQFDGLTPANQSIQTDGLLSSFALTNLELLLTPDELQMIRSFYPIHVLERPFPTTSEIATTTDLFGSADDYYDPDTVFNAAQSIAEAVAILDDTGTYIYPGATCGSIGLEVVVEGQCETTCEVAAEVPVCTTYCQANCQTDCMFSCQSGCQGLCESPCQMTAQP